MRLAERIDHAHHLREAYLDAVRGEMLAGDLDAATVAEERAAHWARVHDRCLDEQAQEQESAL
jgi:hypothetical protein